MACDHPVFDFGEARTGESVRHAFVLRNLDDTEVTILRVRTECGCTTADLSRKQITPGESLALDAELSLKNRRGPQYHILIVDSDDPQDPHFALGFQGRAISDFHIEPDRIHLGQVSPPGQIATTVKITAPPGAAFTRVASDSKHLAAKLEPVPGGAAYRLEVVLRGPLPLGDFRARVFLLTNHPTENEITIPVSASVNRDPRELTARAAGSVGVLALCRGNGLAAIPCLLAAQALELATSAR